jgi:CHASE2 domain-containing sensor protein
LIEHHVSDADIASQSKETENIQQNFPPWHFVVAALAGFVGTFVGWWNLRDGRRGPVSTFIFLCGLALWGYAVFGALGWSGTL